MANTFWILQNLSFEAGIRRKLFLEYEIHRSFTAVLLEHFMGELSTFTYTPGHLTHQLDLSESKAQLLTDLLWCSGNIIEDYSSVSNFLDEGYHKQLILITKAYGRSFSDTIWRLITWNMRILTIWLEYEKVGTSQPFEGFIFENATKLLQIANQSPTNQVQLH